MPIATVVTRGYGSFGSIAEVVTRGYVAGAAAPPVIPDTGKPRRGAPRKRYWWEQERFYLPPHRRKEKEKEEIPLEAAIQDARQELADTSSAVSASEFRRLSGSLGNITRSARALERKIEVAENITEIADQYRVMQARLSAYIDRLDDLKDQHKQRIRKEDEMAVVQILLNLGD